MPAHPEQLIDYGYRAVHEMSVAAKMLITAFYGSGPRLSYWYGCSNGGRQGLMEALRFPSDYDGIIAGAPVNDRTHQLVWEIWIAQAVHHEAASLIPAEKYPAIHRAAMTACDALDGLRDGIIDDPRACRFDPGIIACKGGDAPTCLSDAQVAAARKIYSPAVNPRTHEQVFPALQPGSELLWGALAGPEPAAEAVEFFKRVVFKDPSWSFRTLTFDTAADASDKAAAEVLNATSPDLTDFFDRGGKLLMYHGWSDQLVAPVRTVDYYNSLVERIGDAQRARNSARLFMVPGLNHCTLGDGPNTFDMVGALDRWVDRGVAPDRIEASHATNGVVDRTRPLCPYPQKARYKGQGSIDDAANFECRLQ
jgi:feruloyl esterase